MIKRLAAVVALFLPFAVFPQTTTVPATINSNQSVAPLAYEQSDDGLRTQITTILVDYQSGDKTAGHKLIEQLQLPDSQAWFAEHLGAAQSTDLARRYNRIFIDYAVSLEDTIEAIAAQKNAGLGTKLQNGMGEMPRTDWIRPGQKLSGMKSIEPTQLFFFSFNNTLDHRLLDSWGDTFVYEDGAFRFIGFGGSPFWVWAEGSEGQAPKGGAYLVPAVVIAEVAPIYPIGAEHRQIEGIVSVRVQVEKDGHVSSAEVVQGNPALAQAAIDAVKKWIFRPATMGGQPIPSDTIVNLRFGLPD